MSDTFFGGTTTHPDEPYFEYGEREVAHLAKKCKKLGAAIERIGLLKCKVNPNPFSALIESVIGQQISRKAATTVCKKLRTLTDMNPAKLNSAPIQDIQSCGMSTRKATYIKNIAHAATSGQIDFDNLHTQSDQEIIESLTSIKGVGIWTVEMLLIFSLMRKNVVSFGDLAIRRGMMRLYGHKDMPRDRFERYAKRYSPYGSVASLYLWHISDPGVRIH